MGAVDFTPDALDDLAGIDAHLRPRNEDAASRFAVQVDLECKRLAEWPGLGRPRETDKPSLAGLRSTTVTGFEIYVVLYLPVEGGIKVLNVYHGRRDIDALLRMGR